MNAADLRLEIDLRRREQLGLVSDRCYGAGSRQRYWRGCRCQDCTEAATIYRTERRRRKNREYKR